MQTPLTTTPAPREPERVSIPVGRVRLEGDLVVPDLARGVVLFAHGIGSSTNNARNAFVAKWLQEDANAATLSVDLATPDESRADEVAAELPFDASAFAERVLAVRDWLGEDPRTRALRVGYFGASTGAAAALVAAGRTPNVAAIVSGGGRPDLAGAEALARVQAPTLLIVGGRDEVAIDLNERAQRQMRCETAIEIVPGAGHLFDERRALLELGKRTSAWFKQFM